MVISTENIYNSVSHLSVSEIDSRGDSELRRQQTILELQRLESVSCNHACNRGCVYLSLFEIRPDLCHFRDTPVSFVPFKMYIRILLR